MPHTECSHVAILTLHLFKHMNIQQTDKKLNAPVAEILMFHTLKSNFTTI